MKQIIIGKLPRTSISHILILFILIVLMVIGFGSNCFAQKFISLKTYNVDSLLLVLPGQYDEERINTLNNLALSLFFEDLELGQQYADTAMNLAKELKYEEGMAAAFQNYGHIQTFQGNYPLALSNHLEAISRYEKLDKTHTVAWTYYHIGKAHFFARNYEKAIEYGYKALDKFQERTEGGAMVGNKRDEICMLGGIAIAYDYLGETEKAFEIYLKALDDGKKNIFGMTEILVYTYKVGTLYSLMGDISNAKVYLEKILTFPDTNPDIQALKYRPVTWLGNIYFRLGEIDTAKVYLERAYNWYNKNGFLFWSMYVSNDLGKIHYENKEIDIAQNYFKQSEMIFNEMLSRNSWYKYDSLKYVVNFGLEIYFPYPHIELIEMMWINAKSMYHWLYIISEELKNKDDALKYHVAYFNAVDTLNNIQRNREIIELQTKYESERKDQQIDTLSLENELKESRLDQNRYFLFGSIGLLIVLLMFGYILFRQNKLKTDQQMMGLQQKLFRSQMNPHFIFNSLASIQNFMVKQNSKKASIYLSKFSELVRSILDSSAEEYIPFEKEVSTIENYLELQKVRFPDKFEYSIDVDEKIDPENVLIPPMLAQPFIENSIEHGFKHKKTRGEIKICFSMKNNLIVFEIEDDGIGREKAQEIGYKLNKDHRSMATDITRERLMVLNKKLKQKITLIISDLKDDKNKPAGTKVVFDIPYKYV